MCNPHDLVLLCVCFVRHTAVDCVMGVQCIGYCCCLCCCCVGLPNVSDR